MYVALLHRLLRDTKYFTISCTAGHSFKYKIRNIRARAMLRALDADSNRVRWKRNRICMSRSNEVSSILNRPLLNWASLNLPQIAKRLRVFWLARRNGTGFNFELSFSWQLRGLLFLP